MILNQMDSGKDVPKLKAHSDSVQASDQSFKAFAVVYRQLWSKYDSGVVNYDHFLKVLV